MSQFYQNLDRAGGFDYQLVGLKGQGERNFRGPAIDLDKPFIAYVGAAQTFGRFVERPFPTLLAERLGLPALNLGTGGAGPRHFDRPEYLDALNRAEAVVLQVLSGRSASCSLFDNSATGRMVGVTPFSQTPVRSEEFLKRAASALSAKEFAAVIAEMRADYVASFQTLLEKINAPRILLWFSKRTPDYAEDYNNPPQGVLGEFPQLVNPHMVAEISTHCDHYVECVSTAGLPQRLWRSDRSIEGAHLREDTLVNRYYPSPEMHLAAADLLEGPCRRLTGRRARPTSAERFVVIGAERTGTNLLISLINQYSGCYCGNELFNSSQIEKGKLAWLEVDEATHARLLARRAQDPVGVLDDLREIAHARGYGVVGFKLMYSHGLAHPALLDALSGDTELKVIHVRRRNALRRVVSERQARAANRWAVGRLDTAPIMPTVEIAFDDMVASLMRTQSREADFRTRFAGHDVLEVVYENLAAEPERVAARAAQFLGLAPLDAAPVVKLRKMGSEKLTDALVGAEVLLAQLKRWVTFFEE